MRNWQGKSGQVLVISFLQEDSLVLLRLCKIQNPVAMARGY